MPTSRKGLVIIKLGDELITDKDLILESDISLGISNDYAPLLSGGGNVAVTALTGLVSGTFAGFKQQGFQVWKSTNPIELKLSVSLHMVTSGRLDVTEPAQALMTVAVPTLDDNGWGLIPPGANILEILGQDVKDKLNAIGAKVGFNTDSIDRGKGAVTISIGSYINHKQCIIRNVIPTYSLQEDSEGFPISCKLDIDLTTLDIANNTMIAGLSTARG